MKRLAYRIFPSAETLYAVVFTTVTEKRHPPSGAKPTLPVQAEPFYAKIRIDICPRTVRTVMFFSLMPVR
jgi:hypothetical protein